MFEVQCEAAVKLVDIGRQKAGCLDGREMGIWQVRSFFGVIADWIERDEDGKSTACAVCGSWDGIVLPEL